jgi:hypothetical protein
MLLALVALAAPGCGGDDDDTAVPAACKGGGGPVEDGTEDSHCSEPGGGAIVQQIGKCSSDIALAGGSGGAAGAGGAGGDHDAAGGEGHAEEEAAVLTSHRGADDDCKYDVSFTNSCVELNRPVTFHLTLIRREDQQPATGATPDSPEVFFESEPGHISPSRGITAPEKPKGTYAIGPIVFDRSGRWVVRFHFFERCSDVPPDSPHGHVAFYIDVP